MATLPTRSGTTERTTANRGGFLSINLEHAGSFSRLRLFCVADRCKGRSQRPIPAGEECNVLRA